MSITLNTIAFATYRNLPDSVTLASPSHSISNTDTVAMARVFPKPVKDNDGVARPRLKRVKTLTLADGSKKDAMIEVSGSVPVGASDSDVLALLDDVADTLDLQDAKDLFTKLDINA